jgi:four helix bundle protein
MAQPHDLIGRVHEFALAAFEFYERLPVASKGRSAGEQFYRASSSAESNYRAAKRGRSTAEFIARLGVVVEEIDEAVGWLEHMRDGKIASDPDLLSEAEQLRRIFGRSLGTARRNQRAMEQRRREQKHKDGKHRPSKPPTPDP